MDDLNPWGTYMLTEYIMSGMDTSKLMFLNAIKVEYAAIDLSAICKLLAVFILEERPELQTELSDTPFPDEGSLQYHGDSPFAIVRKIDHDHIILDAECPELWQRFVDSIAEVAKNKFNVSAAIIGNRVELKIHIRS